MGILDVFRKRSDARSRDRPGELATSSRDAGYLTILNALMATKSKQDLEGSEAIYSAVSRIGNTLACMPLHLYKDHEIVQDDPREKLVSYSPTVNLTPYQWKLALEACRDTIGCAYVLIVPGPDGFTPERLDPIDPSKVQHLRNTDTGEIWYQITLEAGQQVTVHNSYVIPLLHMTADGVTGISPIKVLSGTLDYDDKIREVSISQLSGIQESIVLTYPTFMDPAKQMDHVKRFREAYEASGKHVILLDGGVTADTIKGSMADAQVLAVDNITKRKVAAVYNLPPRMLGDATASGYSTSEQDTAEFLNLTMLPIVEQWEQALNRKLLTWEEIRAGYAFRFDMSALKRGDTNAMAEKHSKLIRAATMTPNEARREDGLPDMDYGDELMISRDMVPIRVVLEHPELLLGGTVSGGDEADPQP